MPEKTHSPECACSLHSEELLRSDTSWNGKPYERYPEGRPQLTVLRFHIPPHTSLPWHTHPMPNAGYVISGQITLEERGTGKLRVIGAGQAFAESVDDVHRGYTGDEAAEIVCTYAGVEGQALSIPVK
ncbi:MULTISPECIES: cupin domain-containing protein [Gammaproteobacteria]|uniref:cupin domain-containing protein n=1 Tax=Gammaproteobacteria TaxID=1236 RepID=UPI00112BC840|nr:cupin domain-containing protein [Pseudomonas sp. Hp2]